jgi:predicted phosphoribosyltransferase
MNTEKIHFLPELHDRIHVFRDRTHAGEILADMLEEYRDSDALLLGIPAGGVPVAAEIAIRIGLTFDVIPVSKILFPWTTESGFGAVAFDGTEWINDNIVKYYGLDKDKIQAATREARSKVRRRLQHFRGTRPIPEMKDRSTIVVDDGIAAGSTVRAGILALQKAQAGKIVIAIPTAHDSSLYPIARHVDAIYCANMRGGNSFSVADAYQNWSDINENEIHAILAQMKTAT